MLYAATTVEHARLEYNFSEPMTPVSLQGHFRIGDGAWQAYPPKSMDTFRAAGKEAVELSVHSRAAIPQGQHIFVYVRHVRAQLAVNGVPIFDIGHEGTKPSFTDTPGNLWASFTSPGISPGDDISLTLQRTVDTPYAEQIAPFLESICYGSLWELLKVELRNAWWAIPLVPIFVTLSVMLLFLALHFAWRKEAKLAVQAAFLAGTYSSVALWSLVNYKLMSLVLPFPALIITWETFSFLFAATFIVLYVSTLLTGVRHILALCTASLLCTVMVALVVLQLSSRMELFEIQSSLHILGLCTVVACICLAFMERSNAGKASSKAFITFIPLCLLGCVDIAFNMLGEVTNGAFASMGFIVTSGWQFGLLASEAYKNMQEASRLEREVLESRIALSLSQIRPHFLYNVLTSIQYLCSADPARAERAITDFTAFLRGNLDSLSRSAPILLSQELGHVRHYLALEQMRFGDKLRVEWRLEALDILVPALSVQPLVENAVRWGMREDGLTLHIVTYATGEGAVITVQDDGLGFDPQAKLSPRGTGVGLGSVRTRVCDLHGGSLHVTSAPGKGTVVTLTFPIGALMAEGK